MKLFLLALALLLVWLPQAQALDAQGKTYVGTWLGSLDVGGASLRLVLHVKQDGKGGYVCTLDSPDQGAKDIPVATSTFDGDKVKLDVQVAKGTYEGKANADRTEIVGTWSQGGGSLPLTLKKVDKVEEVRRPQEPKPPFPYDAEDVVYENKTAGNKLAGTLTKPKTGGPFPVALLITGSGPQDRNEALMGHKPFLILSDYLTRRGIAVLRVDDRGVGASTGKFSTATTADFATDVEAGIAFLKTRKDIDPTKIGLIGHSEGGLIGPMVAARSKDVAFVVMMAGPGVSGEAIMALQSALISKAEGASEETVQSNGEVQKQLFAAVKAGKDEADIHAKLQAVVEQITNDVIKKKVPAAQQKPAIDGLKAQVAALSSPWFRYFLTYDPRPALEKVKCPILAINGELDLQVPPSQNLPAIEAALKAGGNPDYTLKKLPKLNHLFQTATTGAPTEYAKIDETLAPIALETMGDWIVKRMK